MLHADAEVILPSTLFRFRRKFEITEQVNFFFLQENPSEDLALSPNSTSSMFATSFIFFPVIFELKQGKHLFVSIHVVSVQQLSVHARVWLSLDGFSALLFCFVYCL